ncbi:MAG: ribosome biogenesis GTP-binding protein YihA/YsxC [Woeseia sp.]
MSQYPDAKFLLSANEPRQFVPDEGSEVAVAGRSNAGKSSAINVIVNRRQFARTSKTPGRTQLINFFELGEGRRLVDLPGYGFARVSAGTRAHWGDLLPRYFEQRGSLKGLLLVVDIRRGPGDYDLKLLALAQSVAVPVHVLLTKADKLKRGQAATALLAARKQLGDAASAQLFSASNRDGLDEARQQLGVFLARNQEAIKKPR